MSPDESQDPARPGEQQPPVPQDAAPGVYEIPQPQPQPYGGYPVAPPKRANTGLIVGLAIACAALVVIGVGGYALTASSRTPGASTAAASESASADAENSAILSAVQAEASTDVGTSAGATSSAAVALPADVDGLRLLKTGNAQQEVSRVRTGVEKGGAMYDNALFGAYGPQANGGWRVVLVDQSFSNLSAAYQSQFDSYAPATLVQAITSEVHMSGTQVEASTDSSAAISCGSLSADGESIPTCIWDDSTTFGIAYYFPAYYTTGLSAAAHYTDDLRAAAEAG